ncbi:MAG TPA: Gfo/Idh/MocA family oxidoreductase [Streptosporangiaceae bacterium]|nr:Gfo/Idh/MocA family oxidoreductase [Streptosporangiaceae bacterium]
MTTAQQQVRWGIIGTANIARAQFLPGLREAGAEAAAVAGRDLPRAEQFAEANQIARAVEGYQRLIDDPEIDALYIPLPNALHAEWTIRALEAGKPVLCEKPLCGTLPDTERVIEAARRTGTLLWEAFSFPFHPQLERIAALVADGAIGELMEIKSNFHFRIRNPANIRLSAALEGGALLDVGCYPVRLAQEFFGPAPASAWAHSTWGGEDVDVDTWGVLDYPQGRRLVLSSGFGRTYDAFTTLEGTGGQIRVTNPFHPGPDDSYELIAAGAEPRRFAAADEASFTALLRHINTVLSEKAEPRVLAVDTSIPLARALHDLAESSRRLR